MKRIYDYRTGKLYESGQSSKSRKINESACKGVSKAELVSIIENEAWWHDREQPICVNGISEKDVFEAAVEAILSNSNDRRYPLVIDAANDRHDVFCDKLFSDTPAVIVINYSTEDDVYDYLSDIFDAAKDKAVILLDVSFTEPALADRCICLNVIDELDTNESVSSRFAKYRKLYEDEDMSSDEESDKDSDEKDSDEDESEGDEGDKDSDEDKESDDKDSDDEDEEVKFDAVVLKVKKDAGEDCKQELIDAGIDEDDIEVVKAEDDDEYDEVKISVDSISELKDYLDGKGIDLEDKLGIDIVEDSDDEEGDGEEGDGDKEEGEGEEEDINFDNFDFDMFGGDESAEDDKK